MKKLKDLPLGERPREKLLERGAGVLSDQELLAVILGKGNRNEDVLSLADKLVKVIDHKGLKFSVQDFMSVDGIGAAKAALIDAAFEFVRRRIKPDGLKITFPADIMPLIQHYSDRKQEHFLGISVNGANEVMNVRVITIGLVNKTQIHPREVFADALSDRASAIIVAHNHPSGSLQPSPEDIRITGQLKEAGNILGVTLLDHIIFSSRGYYSLAEHNDL
ncbi:MAG: DNA repair protein RadC [Desulfotignum sp.]|nr:DNA repair protein RadC [Desulfobacteraceae bacterium]